MALHIGHNRFQLAAHGIPLIVGKLDDSRLNSNTPVHLPDRIEAGVVSTLSAGLVGSDHDCLSTGLHLHLNSF